MARVRVNRGERRKVEELRYATPVGLWCEVQELLKVSKALGLRIISQNDNARGSLVIRRAFFSFLISGVLLETTWLFCPENPFGTSIS